MKIIFELIGYPLANRYFSESSADGKTADDWETAYRHFRKHCNVVLFELSDSRPGVITLSANNNKLRPQVVADIRGHVQNALAQI